MRYLIGAGTRLASDDSVGLRVAEAVVELGLERGFCAAAVASGINLLTYLDPATDDLLIVDCARMGLDPGEFRFFSLDQVESRKSLAGLSTHEGDLLQILTLARETGHAIPPLRFLGIEPQEVGPGASLSPRLEGRLAEYARAAADYFRAPEEPT
jgi:hydrogenase maturation protease